MKTMSAMSANEKIIGTWRLDSYSIKLDSGEDANIWGRRADGLLIYLRNGYMSVHVSNRDRRVFESNDFLNGSVEEIKEAFEGYTCYFGTFEYDGKEKVIYHKVIESVFPNWCGVTHTRYAELVENVLILTTPPIELKDEKGIMKLHWERI